MDVEDVDMSVSSSRTISRDDCYERGKYLIVFRVNRVEFWLEELDSLLDMAGLDPDDVYDRSSASLERPFLRCWFPDDSKAKLVASRSALIRFIIELWGWGSTYDEVLEKISGAPEERKKKYLEDGHCLPWRMDAFAFGRKLSTAEQEDRRNKIAPINLKGPIKMRHENLTQFYILENVQPPEFNASGIPFHVYFGRLVASGIYDIIDKMTLKKRNFLGPTSTETELSFLMANQAKAGKGKIILDPFVGTGSLLIPCTYFGSYCYGADIDARILEGKNSKNAFSNFDQYGLQKPDLWRMDFSPRGCCIRAPPEGLFDAIVCDPPYGIRAGARKSGSRRKLIKPVPEKYKENHIPQTQVYESYDLMPDLVDNAARLLVQGGRLVYLLPVATETYTDDVLPKHPCMKVVANSEDFLTMKISRRLVTMEKILSYDINKQDMYRQETRKHANLLKDNNELPGKYGTEGTKLTKADRRAMKKETREQRRKRKVEKLTTDS
uniref:tRNA (guanine(10)-N(2))-methyltransferase n=1 Tax=Aplanochytrium stocchinoi TaxID=215587 RepID=A0A7S3PME6_9STRA